MSRLTRISSSSSLTFCCNILLQGCIELSDEALLRYYASEWTRYTQGANFVHRLFTYLNRHWVKREKEEGKWNVYTVYTVSLSDSQADQVFAKI